MCLFHLWLKMDYNKLFNIHFQPTTTTTPNPNLNISTKPPPFKIKRSEFIKIINRNLRGIGRLYNLELQDAIKVHIDILVMLGYLKLIQLSFRHRKLLVKNSAGMYRERYQNSCNVSKNKATFGL